MKFIGRAKELEALERLRKKDSASLVVLRGRRRIGKSSLVQQFGRNYRNYFEIQGLGPREGVAGREQLRHFATRLSTHFNARQEHFEDWTEALFALAKRTQRGSWLILLDEISWMGRGDPLFAEKLKEAWDTAFKHNPNLILVVCGSVSSWIEEHIVKNTVFEGRISLDLTLRELTLPEIYEFWKSTPSKFGSLERMMILSITGGVPKYLEEIIQSESAEKNMIRLCFEPQGFLYQEYDKIFGEVFQRTAPLMENLVRSCLVRSCAPQELAAILKTALNSDFSQRLKVLELAGFITRDNYFHPDGSVAKATRLRVSDNYIRFYLKYIEPMKAKIEKGGRVITRWSDLPAFESVLGMQFENLVLANRGRVVKLLELEDRDVVSSAPYVQRATTRTKGACQIDLLVHSNLDVFYLCEFKCRKEIDASVIREVQRKIDVIGVPKRSAVKPVLVYEGEIYPSHREKLQEYFYRIVSLNELALG